MNIFKRLFGSGTSRSSASAPDRDTDTDMKRYLIACLGNIGPEYEGTRHNAGFMVADRLADDAGVSFRSGRYGDMATVRIKNCELLVLKPSTFMNLSGVAVRYWMNHEKLPLDRLLVVVHPAPAQVRLRRRPQRAEEHSRTARHPELRPSALRRGKRLPQGRPDRLRARQVPARRTCEDARSAEACGRGRLDFLSRRPRHRHEPLQPVVLNFLNFPKI